MGLYRDSNKRSQPQGTWRDARNILVSKIQGAITEDEGNIKIDSLPNDFDLISVIALPDETLILFGFDSAISTIAKLNIDNTYEIIIKDDLLNFNKEYIIKSEYEFNIYGEIIIVITDNYNPPRKINIDNLPFDLTGTKELVNPDQINDINLFPSSVAPIVDYDILEGGSVKTGSIFYTFKYINNDSTETNYHNILGPIQVMHNNGSEPGKSSGKSIRFKLSNLDRRFDKIALAVIIDIENVAQPYLIGEYVIKNDTLDILYTGTEVTTDVLLDNLIIKRPLYTKAKTLTSHNNSLYLANLQAEEEVDLQEHANKIILTWNSELFTVDNTRSKSNHKVGHSAGFMHGEVYAFYAAYLLNNGSFTRGFHIPGRALTADDLSIVSEGNSVVDKFRAKDTTIIGSTIVTKSTTNNDIISPTLKNVSNMGAWQNTDEYYDDTFPDFAGQNVRHHVFPTVKKLKETYYANNSKYGISQYDTLGINSYCSRDLPESVADKVVGMVIFYAKPSINNNIIIAEDHPYAAVEPVNAGIPDETYWHTGGTFGVFSQGGTNADNSYHFGTTASRTIKKNILRFNAFDLLKNKPSINPHVISPQLEYKKSNLNDTVATLGKNGTIVNKSGKDSVISAALFDYTADNILTTAATEESISVEDYLYLPSNINSNNYYNLKSNETLILSLANNLNRIGFIDDHSTVYMENNSYLADPDTKLFTTSADKYYSQLVSVRQLLTNVYLNYTNQTLVATDKLLTNLNIGNTLENIYGGDSYVSQYSFIARAPFSSELNSATANRYTNIIIYSFLVHSRNNLNNRYETSDPQTKFYPKSTALDFFRQLGVKDVEETVIDFVSGQQFNQFLISTSNRLNEFNSINVAKEGENFVNKFPYRVIRGGKRQNDALQETSWSTFLPNDYFESSKKKGEILNLEFVGDTLIIHHKYGLFRTIANEKLKTTTTEITLGNQDLFGIEPKEPIDNEFGYLGLQDSNAYTLTKAGYFWLDTIARKVFRLSPNLQVQEISNLGLKNHFNDGIYINNVNSLIDYGTTMCFDDRYNRLLITHLHPTNPFTLSYDIGSNEWVCFHDYLPNYLFNSRSNFYSYTFGDGLYRHNDDSKLSTYSGVTFKSIIEYIFNNDSNVDKHFYAITWQTDKYDVEGNLKPNETIKSIELETTNTNIPDVNIVPFTGYNSSFNTRKIKNSWTYNKLVKRDETNFYKRQKLIDKFLSVKLTLNNLDNSQEIIYLYNTLPIYKPVLR